MRNSTDLVQDRDYWRAFVNMILKLQVPYAKESVVNTGEVERGEANKFLHFSILCMYKSYFKIK